MVDIAVIRLFGYLMMAGMVLFLIIREGRKRKPNAVIWRHPDNGGGIDIDIKEPEKRQVPHFLPWDWWGLKKRPVYFWYEKKEEKPKEMPALPEIPKDADDDHLYCACGYSVKGDEAKKMRAHLLWTPKKGKNKEEFQVKHRIVPMAEHRKHAISAIVEEAKKIPLTELVYILVPYEVKAVIEMTPTGLWDELDWECAHRFESDKRGFVEAVKLGMGLAMVALLVIATFMIADSLRRGV